MRKSILSIFILLFLFACDEKQPEEKVKEGKKESVTEYYPSGIKKVEGKMLNGKRTGKWVYYYENGFIWSEGVFKDDVRDGYSMVYHENGKIKTQGNYRDNKKVGKWKFWSSTGDLVKTVDFDKE